MVITVPVAACFNVTQCNVTKDAATIASLNVICITSSPTAVALTYCLCCRREEGKNVLIFDLPLIYPL